MGIKVSSKGQIVIPADVREKFRIETGTELEVEEGDGIIKLIPPVRLTDLCGTWEFDKEEIDKEIEKMRRDTR